MFSARVAVRLALRSRHCEGPSLGFQFHPPVAVTLPSTESCRIRAGPRVTPGEGHDTAISRSVCQRLPGRAWFQSAATPGGPAVGPGALSTSRVQAATSRCSRWPTGQYPYRLCSFVPPESMSASGRRRRADPQARLAKRRPPAGSTLRKDGPTAGGWSRRTHVGELRSASRLLCNAMAGDRPLKCLTLREVMPCRLRCSVHR
jgi:hypothetical protein